MPAPRKSTKQPPSPAPGEKFGFSTIAPTEPAEGPGSVPPVPARALAAAGAEPIVAPANSTLRSRRAARLAREREHGLPTRRRLGLKAGDDADNDFHLTSVNDDDHGSPT